MASSKTKIAFYCQSCGNEYAKWLGQCPSCKAWNTIVEEPVHKDDKQKNVFLHTDEAPRGAKTLALQDVQTNTEKRLATPDDELNRVLGGGIVMGSVTLISGEPGIGKSTLFLQLGLSLQQQKILYVSGEESMQQIKMRAERVGIQHDEFYLLTETETQTIFAEVKKIKPDLLIIDSIQTLHSPFVDSSAGSVSQVKECASELIRFAKLTNTPVFIIGHINKDGAVAGPKVLEHMVDAVLQFEGDRQYSYRILRGIKNRFGSSSELGIYEMQQGGLRQVSNPSEILISQKEENMSGTAISATLEGIRPLLIETQALVTQAVYGTPQRTVSGYDLRKLQLILAVLEKRGGFHYGTKDVFLNIAGGIKIEDPAMDLAIACALLSSYEDVAISQMYAFAGEIGLSGEVRSVNRIEQRISEAEKLGFEKIFISKYNLKGIDQKKLKIELVPIAKVEDVYRILF
ncbi:MAG: repair protein RadA [Bacteroidota bacterium]|jgi:DNA repair protein RadA/Sms